MSRRTVCMVPSVSFLACCSSSGVIAGLTELSWQSGDASEPYASSIAVDSDGGLLVGGCIDDTKTSSKLLYVTKYAPTGEPYWRQLVGYSRSECIIMLATNGIQNDDDNDGGGPHIFVAAAATDPSRGEAVDDDLVIVRIDSLGNIVWQQVVGTPQQDEPTSIHVDPSGANVSITGFSSGNLSQGRDSTTSNCEAWHRSAVATTISLWNDECNAGFVLTLDASTGDQRWLHEVSAQSDDRVFDLDIDATIGNLYIIGDTKGDLREGSSSANNSSIHAGEIFVRKLNARTGLALWTTQLGASFSSLASSAATRCRIQGFSSASAKRGNCGLTLSFEDARTSDEGLQHEARSIVITGTTDGLLSTFESETQTYAALCQKTNKKTRKSTVCSYQTLVAKMRTENGDVEWIHQWVSTAANNAEGIIRIAANTAGLVNNNSNSQSEAFAVLALADAGFSSTDAMEQLVATRMSSSDGTNEWNREIGLPGHDQALGFAVADPLGSVFFVLGYGFQDKRRTGNASPSSSSLGSSYIHKLSATSGTNLPLCADSVAFQTNATRVQQREKERIVVSLTVERSNAECGSGQVSYSTQTRSARPQVDFMMTSGVVQFARGQHTAAIVVDVLPASVTDTQTTFEQIRSFALVLDTDPGSTIADGYFWRRMTRICTIAVGLGLVLVL
uniref:Calx-beta domain-containing protein n=1 Tax=Globisporangium ultimum (strain ATCC 200006 / CBS 805.95 / DAOM BR144) TaxID=431595 RepID=K3WMW3_GLOUD